ncbi:MAG TPA: DUF4386 family protein, partial [Pseudonocardia sp.]|nr:DUF4386 family protein [Pseudonocardia sp.]
PPPDRAAGVAAIVAAAVFTAAFALLGVTFDYPAVLDEGAAQILARYADAGTATRALWYLMMVASLAFVPVAVLLGRSLAARLPGRSALNDLTVTIGVLAGLLQAVGFARWTFVVPYLAQAYTDPAATPATRDAVVVAFEVVHRFVGGALGEHLGFALTAAWALGVAVLLARAARRPDLGKASSLSLNLGKDAFLPLVGAVSALAIATGTVEVTGATWPGLPVAAGYALFAAWLVWIGVRMLARRP